MQQYRGILTLSQIAEGYNLAVRNAKRLLADAEYLLQAKRYLSTITIATLAMEEEGKTGLFTVLSLADSDSEVKEFWKSYRRHTAKNRHLLFIKAMGPTRENGVFSATGEALKSHAEAATIENTKQLCTYTDCVRQKEWHSPELIAPEYQEKLASGMVFICRSLSFSEITQQQLEIYAKHLRPAKRASKEYVEHALVGCLRELQEAGILAHRASEAELIDLICGTK